MKIQCDDIIIEIPMEIFLPHERQAQYNHGQTLNRLNERGGLDLCEAYAIVKNTTYRNVKNIDKEFIRSYFKKLIDDLNGGITSYKYIYFKLTEKKTKTNVYECRNNASDDLLGIIKWYPGWRQYCYFPTCAAVYSKGCLDDIRDFIDKITREKTEGKNGKA